MRNIVALIFSLAVMVLFANNVQAQKAKTEIASVKQSGEVIRFTVTSSKPLIFGNNRYILYIGDKEFTLSETPADENNKTITFLLREDEFKALNEGAVIYLSYGHLNMEGQDVAAYAQRSHKCWQLGNFRSGMLVK